MNIRTPCRKCIVKVMCSQACPEYYNWIKSVYYMYVVCFFRRLKNEKVSMFALILLVLQCFNIIAILVIKGCE